MQMHLVMRIYLNTENESRERRFMPRIFPTVLSAGMSIISIHDPQTFPFIFMNIFVDICTWY